MLNATVVKTDMHSALYQMHLPVISRPNPQRISLNTSGIFSLKCSPGDACVQVQKNKTTASKKP